MTSSGQSVSHLSESQREVLSRIAARHLYVGFDGNEDRTCRSLVRRGLARRQEGQLPKYAITPTGRARLDRCR